MTAEERAAELAKVRAEYESYAAQGLKLDMSRGKPSAAQLALSEGMLGIMSSAADCFTETGFDCRNYGVLDGIPEAKRIFSDILGIPAANIIVAGNSSLNIMYDELARLMLYGAVGVEKPWSHEENIKFICAVPGYDRHFTICEALGIELVNVDMTPEGPIWMPLRSLPATRASRVCGVCRNTRIPTELHIPTRPSVALHGSLPPPPISACSGMRRTSFTRSARRTISC